MATTRRGSRIDIASCSSNTTTLRPDSGMAMNSGWRTNSSEPSAILRWKGTNGCLRTASRRALSSIGITRTRLIVLAAGSTQGRHGEYYRIQLLEIPEAGEVKANRRRVLQATGFHLLDEPGQSAIHRGPGVGAGIE